MPRDFQFPPNDPAVDLWSPLTINLSALASRPHRMYNAIGRLAAGANIEQARQEMTAVAATIARENPDAQNGWSATLVPARFMGLGDRLGSVGEGKTASLALVRANPLEDVRNAEQIEGVFLRGRYFGRDDLGQLLAEASALAHPAA